MFDNERSIKHSRDIPIWRILPFFLPLVAIFIMSSDDQLFSQCIGKVPAYTSASGAKYVTFFRILIALPCSPYYVQEFSRHWIVIAVFTVGVALAIPQFLWMRQHKTYWDSVREREKAKRAEKAAAKAKNDVDLR